jgi:SAM-dependent methyltransferase
MCLHNHLVGRHNQGAEYLRQSGWAAWTTIHDNLHNDPNFTGQGGTRRYVGSRITAPKETSAFAPTPLDVVEKMLDAADVGPEDVVCDLGCGDGRILVMAALKHGATAAGLDIDPECVEEANANLRRHGVDHLARAYLGDARDVDLTGATVVTLYLMPSLSGDLRAKLQSLPAGTRIVAHDKPIPGWEPSGRLSITSSVDKREHFVYTWRVGEAKEKPKCKT